MLIPKEFFLGSASVLGGWMTQTSSASFLSPHCCLRLPSSAFLSVSKKVSPSSPSYLPAPDLCPHTSYPHCFPLVLWLLESLQLHPFSWLTEDSELLYFLEPESQPDHRLCSPLFPPANCCVGDSEFGLLTGPGSHLGSPVAPLCDLTLVSSPHL